jgi:hypothetical protein
MSSPVVAVPAVVVCSILLVAWIVWWCFSAP